MSASRDKMLALTFVPFETRFCDPSGTDKTADPILPSFVCESDHRHSSTEALDLAVRSTGFTPK